MTARTILAACAAFAVALPMSVRAQESASEVRAPAVSSPMVYQGQLSYLDIPVTTTADLRFRLYDDAGAQLGDEVTTDGVDLIEGAFETVLDFGVAGGGWLEVDVRSPAGEGEYVTLSPRQRISALPPVFGDGASLGADGASAPDEAGGRGLIAQRPGAGQGGGDVLGDGVAAGAGQGDRPGQSADAGGGSRGAGWLMAGSVVFYNGGNVGIGTGAPDAKLHVRSGGARTVKIENTTAGGGNFALQVDAAGLTSRAIFARATRTVGQNYGVFGQSLSSRGTGVFGQAQSPFGVTYGVTGVSRAASGTGVRGLATNPTGSPVGVLGVSNGLTGIGVSGLASSTTTGGFTFGVRGESRSTAGAGVFGNAVNDTPSSTGNGVQGFTNSAFGNGVVGFLLGTGTGAAVKGQSFSPNGFAGEFTGGLGLQTTSLTVTAIGDSTVALGADAINAGEILNEAGLANVKGGLTSFPLSGGVELTLTRTITVPSSGFVIAIGSATVFHDHVSGNGASVGLIGVSNNIAAFAADNTGQYQLHSDVPTGRYLSTISSLGVFSVSPGTNAFFLHRLGVPTQTSTIEDATMVLLFVPTAYGTTELSTPLPMTPPTGGISESVELGLPALGALALAGTDPTSAPPQRPSRLDRIETENAELRERLLLLESLILEGEF